MSNENDKPAPLPREMMDRWAARLPDRTTILDFWDWLTKKHAGVKLGLYLDEIDIEKELNEYHEIDKRKLDDERRAALERQRQFSES